MSTWSSIPECQQACLEWTHTAWMSTTGSYICSASWKKTFLIRGHPAIIFRVLVYFSSYWPHELTVMSCMLSLSCAHDSSPSSLCISSIGLWAISTGCFIKGRCWYFGFLKILRPWAFGTCTQCCAVAPGTCGEVVVLRISGPFFGTVIGLGSLFFETTAPSSSSTRASRSPEAEFSCRVFIQPWGQELSISIKGLDWKGQWIVLQISMIW